MLALKLLLPQIHGVFMKNLVLILGVCFSSFSFANPITMTVSGNLSLVAAIGGETTGFLVDGVEVDFSEFKKGSAIPEGSGIVVTGQLEQREGTTRGTYEVLVAKDLQISIRGTVVGMMAIGGESTGIALMTDEGRLFEMDISTSNINSQVELLDRNVEVSGNLVKRQGVSRKNFEVLNVKNILF